MLDTPRVLFGNGLIKWRILAVDNIHRLAVPDPATGPRSSGRGGGGIEGRLSALETRIEYLATKKDIQKLKVWVLGGVIAALVIGASLAVAVVKLFL